jgi:hypothetical protein
MGLLFFVLYINNLPLRVNSVSKPLLFADDTSFIISSKNLKVSLQLQI